MFTVPYTRCVDSALVRRLVLVAVAAVLALVPIAAQASPRADAGVFAGLGTWIDIYDAPAYRSPGPTAAKIAARGVKTVYVETANDRSAVDVVNPKALGLFVDALKARGIRVVAWYLPGFVKPAVDARRAARDARVQDAQRRVVRRRRARHRVAESQERLPHGRRAC